MTPSTRSELLNRLDSIDKRNEELHDELNEGEENYSNTEYLRFTAMEQLIELVRDIVKEMPCSQ